MADANWYPKREAKRFEPPPWEREQFEAMQRRRVEEEQASAEEPAPEEEPAGLEPAEPAQEAAEAPRGVSEAELDAMLAQLQAEEPRAEEHLKAVGLFAAAIAAIVGVSMLAWGSYMLMTAQGRLAAVVGALILLAMGSVLGLTGLWVGRNATSRQGDG